MPSKNRSGVFVPICPRGLLREQVRPGLRERQISAGRMHRKPAVHDCGFNGHAVFLITATGISKLRIDDLDSKSTSVIGVCTENPIRVYRMIESAKLAR
jgi:hypothetical protein